MESVTFYCKERDLIWIYVSLDAETISDFGRILDSSYVLGSDCYLKNAILFSKS